jgi:hypothetical protein
MDETIRLAQITYWTESNPSDTYLFLGVVAAIIVTAIMYNLIRNKFRGTTTATGRRTSRGSKEPSFNRSSFKRRAHDAGFSEGESDFLEQYARKLGVANPATLFSNQAQLDSFMRSAFKHIERQADTEESAEQQKSQLFAIREALAMRMNSGSMMHSTRNLPAKTPLSIVTAKDTQYTSIVVANDAKALYVEPALDSFGQALKLGWGTRVTIYFYTGNHVGYSFKSYCKGLVDGGGHQLLAIRHTTKITSLPSRKHQRREARLACRFYLVHIRETRDRGRLVKHAQVEKAAVAGIITDLSAGGMSMQTMSPARSGETIKVEFDVGGGNRAVFAYVVRTSRMRNGASMHLKFAKMSPKIANELRAFVYAYD